MHVRTRKGGLEAAAAAGARQHSAADCICGTSCSSPIPPIPRLCPAPRTPHPAPRNLTTIRLVDAVEKQEEGSTEYARRRPHGKPALPTILLYVGTDPARCRAGSAATCVAALDGREGSGAAGSFCASSNSTPVCVRTRRELLTLLSAGVVGESGESMPVAAIASTDSCASSQVEGFLSCRLRVCRASWWDGVRQKSRVASGG